MEIVVAGQGSPLLQQALALRQEVFVLEQGVPVELEIDEQDETALHFVALQDGVVVATMRLLPYGDAVKIGRVAVRLDVRRRGIGARLMRHGIEHARQIGAGSVMLDAQVSSMPFYLSLGFVGEGEPFDDAGIPHLRMRLKVR